MRTRVLFLCTLAVLRPVVADAQILRIQGAAGPTLVDRGYSLAAGAGLAAGSRITVLADFERTSLVSRVRSDGRGSVSAFRGGTLTLGAAELRVSIRPHDRVGPYGVAGFAAGVSRPNVNATFPNPVTNDVRAIFFGGGIHVPVRGRLALFADARMMAGSEAGELLAVAPLRAGLSWRF